jgi:hypothetical protein
MIELLLDKDSGSQELKKLLGFVDANISYTNLYSDLVTASLEMVKIVGNEVYAEAIKDYKEATNPDFVYLMQIAIVSNAYREYVKANDLSHTNDGRKARIDEYEKTAFEWQINKNDAALERKYYRALDHLLEYLDKNIETWNESENYKKAHKTLIKSTDDFADVFPLDSRYLFEKLVPGLVQCEHFDIIPRIGKERLNALKTEVKPADEELLCYVRYAMVFRALSWGYRRLSVNLFPEGMVSSYLINKNMNERRSAANEAQEASQQFGWDADAYLQKIESFIQAEKAESANNTDNSPPLKETKPANDFKFKDNDNFISTT